LAAFERRLEEAVAAASQPLLFEDEDLDRYRDAVAACSEEDRSAWIELCRWARCEPSARECRG
jgi:hypothetical protein